MLLIIILVSMHLLCLVFDRVKTVYYSYLSKAWSVVRTIVKDGIEGFKPGHQWYERLIVLLWPISFILILFAITVIAPYHSIVSTIKGAI